jgi:hypothetical protein
VRKAHERIPVKLFPINKIPIGTAPAYAHRLKLFRITKSGLLAITISVFALWGSIALETAALNRATRDARTAVKTLERLRERSVPASEPLPSFHSQGAKSA